MISNQCGIRRGPATEAVLKKWPAGADSENVFHKLAEQFYFYNIYGSLIEQHTPTGSFYTTDYVFANGEPVMRIDTLEHLGLAPSGPSKAALDYSSLLSPAAEILRDR